MSSIKPTISETTIRAELEFVMGAPISNLNPLGDGQVMQSFTFSAGGQQFVIRISSPALEERFSKEIFVSENFGTSQLPLPSVFHISQLAGLRYGISQRVPGKSLNQYPAEIITVLMPQIMMVTDALRQVDVSATTDYGWLTLRGGATFKSWQDHLLFVREQEDEGMFFGKWHRLFDETFLDRATFDAFFAQMQALLQYCPPDRHLIHGNYGLSNILATETKITAVVDWADAGYGDFVFNLAPLTLWWGEYEFDKHYQAYCQDHAIDIPFFAERLLCYQLFQGLDAMRFFAKTNNAETYHWVVSRLHGLVNLKGN